MKVRNLVLALVAVVAGTASAQDVADRIWSGGTILTMNDKAMRAEAVGRTAARSSR